MKHRRRPRLTHMAFHPRRRRHLTIRASIAANGSYISVETGHGQWTVSI
jgi:hypothetical protein